MLGEKIRVSLAFALIITEMSYYWRLVGIPALGPSPLEHLPITVCGWCVMAGVISALFFISYLPWYLKDKKAAKQPTEIK